MTNKQTNDSTFKSYGSFYDEPVDVQKHNLMRQEISFEKTDSTVRILMRSIYRVSSGRCADTGLGLT